MRLPLRFAPLAVGLLFLLPVASPAQPAPKTDPRFERTEAMVEMRDGVKLYTAVYTPKDAKDPLPIVLMRTPYGIDSRAERAFQSYYKELAAEGYIFAFQDIRGRFKSEGTFVMTRPARDPKDPKGIDEASDTHDSIEWMLKNVKGNNGRVGMLGISYPGWLTAVAMLDPHPALRAASPQASPVDMFLGDDFHHNGAFRLSYGFEYVAMMETDKTNANFQFDRRDTYEWYLKLGALSNVNRLHFKDKMPTWNDFVAHPNYDSFWKKMSLEPRLTTVKVPALHVAGWYDQEDFRGPLKIYELLEKHDTKNQNFLAVGPWNHGGWAGKAERLGGVSFDSDTGAHFREKIQAPFFAHYLKDKGPAPSAEARMFQTGANRWESYETWPPKPATPTKLYLSPDGKLAFTPPADTDTPFDEYVSDPANPVPYRPRPVRPTYPGPEWPVWMVQDQRFTHGRPDVLTYETDPLTEDLTVAGSMTVKLFASTSGTDCDWIVRLIDVYPEEYPTDPEMGGYQLMIAGEPVRARFRKSFEKPEPVKPDEFAEYTIDLNWGHHCFRKGHRVMIQVSSTWFPLIDRNPQKFVPNIFEATDTDFQKARQRVLRSPGFASHVTLQTLPVPNGVAPAQAVQPKPKATYDLVIRNGTIVDGTGNPWFVGDLAITGDKIVAVGRVPEGDAKRVIDAKGLVVAPGFIDVHSHSDELLLEDGHAQSKIRQGVTTEVLGEGRSAGPSKGQLSPRKLKARGKEFTWSTLGDYLDAIDNAGVSVNVASYCGLDNVWEGVMGKSHARPTKQQLDEMKVLLDEAMKDGAFGMSSMLMMPPGSLATTDDIAELCKVVKKHGGLFSSHIRNEGLGVFDSVKEAIAVGERAGVPVDVIHIKIADEKNWGKMGEVVAMIDAARKRGVNVQANVYPYTRGNNNLSSIIPPWAHEGGRAKFLERLKTPADRERMKKDIKGGIEGWYNHYTAVGGDWSRMLVSGRGQFEGLTMDRVIALISKGKTPTPDPLDVLFDILIDEDGSVPTVYAHHDEKDMNLALRQPWCSIGSDGSAYAAEGPLKRGNPHPRNFGTFPRVLGVYVREKGVLTLEDAVRKMTSLNAAKLGIRDRGELRPGTFADVTIFDPKTVIDQSTYTAPFAYNVGIEYVIVNGRVVLDRGKHTDATPGRALRRAP